MAREQDRQDDLNAFEAAWAALTPRSERLNRDRLMFLAGQASRRDTRPRRGAWPAAFVAMTTVAASLLVALVARPPQVVERVVERVVEVQVPAAARDAALADMNRRDRSATRNDTWPVAPRRWTEPPGNWTAFLFFPPTESSPAVYRAPDTASSYMHLREIALTRGVNGWSTPGGVDVAGASMSSRSRPVSQRELLDELLPKPDVGPPQRSEVSPESTTYPGARS